MIGPHETTCGTAHTGRTEKDVMIAYEHPLSFEHEMQNALPSAGLLADWVLADLKNRAVICSRLLCDIFKYLAADISLIEVRQGAFQCALLELTPTVRAV